MNTTATVTEAHTDIVVGRVSIVFPVGTTVELLPTVQGDGPVLVDGHVLVDVEGFYAAIPTTKLAF